MDKELVEDTFYQIIDQFNGRKNTSVKFYSFNTVKEKHSFYDGLVERLTYSLLMMI